MNMIGHDDIANQFEGAVTLCLGQAIDKQLTSVIIAKDRNPFESYGGYIMKGVRLIRFEQLHTC